MDDNWGSTLQPAELPPAQTLTTQTLLSKACKDSKKKEGQAEEIKEIRSGDTTMRYVSALYIAYQH